MMALTMEEVAEMAQKSLCPMRFGHIQRTCQVSNCMAWRQEIRMEDGMEVFYGWCGLCGDPRREGVGLSCAKASPDPE